METLKRKLYYHKLQQKKPPPSATIFLVHKQTIFKQHLGAIRKLAQAHECDLLQRPAAERDPQCASGRRKEEVRRMCLTGGDEIKSGDFPVDCSF